MAFLPVSAADLAARGWEGIDFLFITGDAYVDHPSFGAALLTRLLESEGYRVGIAAQPDPRDPQSLLAMGRPSHGVFLSSGVVDSMVNHYTAAGRKRSDDRYSPGGKAGRRPDRALIRYGQMVREQLGDIPLVIGGIEASLRRFAHYDYWSDSVRRSILEDSQADLLVYGMGELPILEIARLLARGARIERICTLRGTAVLRRPDQLPNKLADAIASLEASLESTPETGPDDSPVEAGTDDSQNHMSPDDSRNEARPADIQTETGPDAGLTETSSDRPFPQTGTLVLLPDAESVRGDRRLYARAFQVQQSEQDPASGRTLVQRHHRRLVVQNPPQRPMTTTEMDLIYDLPYERRAHPMYDAEGGVPALAEVRFSINSHRGCYGSCAFCAIAYHQGRIIQNRSADSIIREGTLLTGLDGFKGYIHDVGGPTANFYEPACDKQAGGAVCRERLCLWPKPCPRLRSSHTAYIGVLRRLRALPGVKKVFVRSGVRFDAVVRDPDPAFLEELCRYHISGQLKVAPEHTVDSVLSVMRKPAHAVYEEFAERFRATNERLGLRQFLVPYLISGHPGCTLEQSVELAGYIRAHKVIPEQVQDFYPTPGTVATAMYWTGLDPQTLQPVHVPDPEEKAMQRALLQFSLPENRALVEKALQRLGRTDLIGYHPEALLLPERTRRGSGGQGSGGPRSGGQGRGGPDIGRPGRGGPPRRGR